MLVIRSGLRGSTEGGDKPFSRTCQGQHSGDDQGDAGGDPASEAGTEEGVQKSGGERTEGPVTGPRTRVCQCHIGSSEKLHQRRRETDFVRHARFFGKLRLH